MMSLRKKPTIKGGGPSNPTSPVSPADSVPHRSATMGTMTTTGSGSDEEAIPDTDLSGTSEILLERLQAWKHMCGNLESYIAATEKVQKAQAKEYEKILKTISSPLKEAHHFDPGQGGVAGMFENLRANTQGISNTHIETEKNLKGIVLPILERLHAEIKSKTKEIRSGAAKTSKLVEKARGLTQKHIELLGQYSASFDAVGGGKIEPAHDPYILRRGVSHRLNKQIIEENNHRQDLLVVQNSFLQFETHVLQTIQNAFSQFLQFMGGQAERQRTMYADMVSSAQNIPDDFEWASFAVRHESVLINPDAPPKSMAHTTFPNQDHPSVNPTIEGTIERKSRAALKGFSAGHYVVTPAGYMHGFKDNDDYHHEPSPDFTLYLPDSVIGGIDGSKFNVKGKDVSGGKVGSAFSITSDFQFKTATPSDAEKWWTVIRTAINAGGKTSASASDPVSPSGTVSRTASGAQHSEVSKEEAESKESKEVKDTKEEKTTTAAPATETSGAGLSAQTEGTVTTTTDLAGDKA
ncbi:hypothetical protein FQN54_001555 [Arachnomyces sp. PD_36]|nr:hypothetical protein FQN54_001555 [Arachnomyces sp. PD_36]